MKNNLDKAIKESLQDFEMPYDPAAWEALSAKLDAQATQTEGTPKSGISKWLLTGAIAGAIGLSTYLLWPETSSEVAQQKAVTTDEIIQPTKENKTEKDTENVQLNNVAEEETEQQESANDEVTERIVNMPQENVDDKVSVDKNTPQNVVDEENTRNHHVAPIVEKNETNYISGSLSFDVVCRGDNVMITNEGEANDLVRFNFNDKWIELQNGKSYLIKAEASFTLTFVDKSGKELESKDVKVYDLPSANFRFEANIFDKGLPIVTCEAYRDYASYTWSFDGEEKEGESTMNHHFFDKGDYPVSLKVVDRNGCENTFTQVIQIHEKYNLMAVDAFKPNSSDPRSRTFMPYSLTERDVKFQLTIVDPINNEVVFESSDAKNTWDGVHQKTGVMTPAGKAYVWKVQIFNPLPNERPIYKGTIIHD